MSTNDPGRRSAVQQSRSLLILAGIAVLSLLIAAAVTGAYLVPLAGVVLISALVGYLMSSHTEEASSPGLSAPADAADTLPGTARAILDALMDPLIVLDESKRIVLANRASIPLIGFESLRKHISAAFRNPELLESIDRVLAGGEAESITFTYFAPVERYYQAYVASTKGTNSDSVLILIQLHDLTAMRRVEEMRADFVANASHELRTPLAAVSGFIDTLRGHAKDDSEARERFLDIMSVETGRMRRLIDDLLSLTRIELNEHNPPVSTIDLVHVVHDAAAAMAPLAEMDGIALKIDESAPLLAVGDRDEMMQVFQNLIHNAIKYGREQGTVYVHFGRVPASGRHDPYGQVYAAVRDEGEGIPREAIPRLTERFYRVDVKRSRERGGTGLGLAIVKHILNRHHGRLQIKSALGQGSTFTVYLPAAAPAGANATVPEQAPDSSPA